MKLLTITILLLLQSLFSLSLSLSLHNQHKHKHTHKHTHKHKHKHKQNRDTWRVVRRTEQFLKQQQVEGQKGEAIMNTNPEGRSPVTDPLKSEGEVYLRVRHKLSQEEDQQSFDSLHYKLNTHYLYFLQANDMRAVSFGIDLATIPMAQENVKEFECCARIHDIKHVQIEVYNFQGYCFNVDGQTDDYLLCMTDEGALKELQQNLVESVIANYYQRVLPLEEMPRLIKEGKDMSVFSWNDQNSWGGHCQQNTANTQQSPVSISSATQVYDESLKFHWHTVSGLQYNIQDNQLTIHGSFGSFTHQGQEDHHYMMNKLVFKAPKSEHSWSTYGSAGELQLFGQDSNMVQSILSIELISAGTHNTFIGGLSLEGLSPTTQLKCLSNTQQVSIDDLLNSNPDLKSDHSFYRYKGSHSTPPCLSNVQRYLMKQPAYIDSHQAALLRSTILSSAGNTNVRQLQPLHTNVYFQQSVQCHKDKQLHKVALEPQDYKFIKATQKVHGYVMADESSDALFDKVFTTHANKHGDIRVSDDLVLKRVKKHQVPELAHQELTSKWRNSPTVQIMAKRKRMRRRM